MRSQQQVKRAIWESCYIGVAGLAGLVSIALLLFGLWEMWKSVADSLSSHGSSTLMTAVLHGLDFVFLSPLPFLAATGVILYVRAEVTADNVEAVMARLHRTKFLIGTLLFAVITTTMTARLVAKETTSGADVALAAVLVAGSLLFLVVLRLGGRH